MPEDDLDALTRWRMRTEIAALEDATTTVVINPDGDIELKEGR